MAARRGERPSEEVRRDRAEGAAAIRREFNRHFVNANLLRVIWTAQGVQVVGRMEKQYERMRAEGFDALADRDAFNPVNARFLRELDRAVREAGGVKQVDWKLDDWLCAGGEFMPLG